MKIIDMHIHMGPVPEQGDILDNMAKAGVYGGCIFSPRPKQHNPVTGMDFEPRLEAVLKFCEGRRDRLFPILWIDPREDNILANIDKAIEDGIDGFKIICSTLFVYEEESIEVLKYIASKGKPVFFHSGILWDGKVSSAYNRPMNWESLLHIEGLRFSMGHCSWPWMDECIAMYGKFLNSDNKGTTKHAEMFLDITPGTPDIYREELMAKLFTIGYDFNHNLMFGTDTYAEKYSSSWAAHWLETDRKLMDKFGVCKAVRENIYYNNVLRFLGKTDTAVEHARPSEDDANAWSPVNDEVKDVIRKWHDKIGFADLYKGEFERALKTVKISDAITIDGYDVTEPDGKRNLLSYLFFCEQLERRYKEKGISEEILMDTLGDISIWTDVWSGIKGELYLGEVAWLKRHMDMKLFKLGRLQFCMAGSEFDIPEIGVQKGDNVIEVHIPEGEAMTPSACADSIEKAKAFFAKYFPEFEYKYFTCHSWLLDTSLKEILPADSNIVKLQNLFTIVRADKSDAILKYVFYWNTTRYMAKKLPCATSFAKAVQQRVRADGDFYESLGYFAK